jgi:hypothetical protein
MTAATMTATTAGPILALDLGKYKRVARAYPGDELPPPWTPASLSLLPEEEKEEKRSKLT